MVTAKDKQKGLAPQNPSESIASQLPTSQYEVPEPVIQSDDNTETSTPPSPEPEPKEKETSTTVQALSPETFVAANLAAGKATLEQLNKQIALLTNEVSQYKGLTQESALESQESDNKGDKFNNIQLTIRYPGTGSNRSTNADRAMEVKNRAIERQTIIQMAGGNSESKVPDPLMLRVPVVVIAPISSTNYKATEAKLMQEGLTPESDLSNYLKLQNIVLHSPEAQNTANGQEFKEAVANAAFFENDLTVTKKRLHSKHPN